MLAKSGHKGLCVFIDCWLLVTFWRVEWDSNPRPSTPKQRGRCATTVPSTLIDSITKTSSTMKSKYPTIVVDIQLSVSEQQHFSTFKSSSF